MNHQLRYLSGVLTVIAVLLTLNLWTQWQASPGGAALSAANPAQAQTGIAPGAQRAQIIDLLKALNVQAAETHKLLSGGKMQVQVHMPEPDQD